MSSSSTSSSESQSAPIPLEIFYQILENVPRTSLTSIARANASFNEVSEKFIYRRLELTSIAQAQKCFATLASKPGAARCVREFVVMISGTRNCTAELGPQLAAALQALPQLIELHLAVEGPYLPALQGCNFPCLTTFSSIADLYPQPKYLADFLTRHPTITSLCLGGDSGAPSQRACSIRLPEGSLPNLSSYMGSRRLVPALIPGRPVRRVTLAWHAPNVELEIGYVIPELAKTLTPVQSFSVATPGWSSALLRALATYLPGLHSLRLHNVSADYHNEVDICQTLAEVLPAFKRLSRIELPCHKNIRSILNEGQAAKTWAGQSPSLHAIVFPSGRTWQKTEKGNWAQVTSR